MRERDDCAIARLTHSLFFPPRAQLSYGAQMRFLGKPISKLYWKEGERNKHDTVQANWMGQILLGTGAIQIASALDGEATKNQLAGAAIFWGLSIPEFINQREASTRRCAPC